MKSLHTYIKGAKCSLCQEKIERNYNRSSKLCLLQLDIGGKTFGKLLLITIYLCHEIRKEYFYIPTPYYIHTFNTSLTLCNVYERINGGFSEL